MFLVAVDAEVPPLVVVAGGLEAGQRPVLSGPGVHDRVDQLVPGRLARYRGRLQSRVSAKIFVGNRKNICTLLFILECRILIHGTSKVSEGHR